MDRKMHRHDDMTGLPLPASSARRPAPPSRRAERDLWLRLALFATVLGALLTAASAWMLARQDAAGFSSYHRVLVPLLALTATAGALMLERATVQAMLLLLVSTALALAGGGIWLVPGAVCACVWAARHSTAARVTLGFLLLVPGVAAVFYGLFGALSYGSRISIQGLPSPLSSPLSLRQALAPLQLLPVAVLGAWLLLSRHGSDLN